MRPSIIQLTCTTAVPTSATFDATDWTQKALQLTNADANWAGQAVAVQASLDGGTTWGTVVTVYGVGFYILPDVVLGKIRLVATGLAASTTILAFLGAANMRTDN